MEIIKYITENISIATHIKELINPSKLSAISSSIAAIANVFIAYKMYKLSKKQKGYHEKEITIKNQPFLYPISNEFIKDKYKRYEKDAGTSSEWIKYKYANQNIKTLIDECLEEDNRGKVYMTYFESIPVLMTNRSDKNYIYLNHHNMIMTLENQGATLQYIKINSFKIILLNNQEVDIFGKENCYFPMPVTHGQRIQILIDEAISDINESFCNVHEEAYKSLEDFDQLKTKAQVQLSYKSMALNVSLYNMFGDEFIYNIKIALEGTYFRQSVEQIST